MHRIGQATTVRFLVLSVVGLLARGACWADETPTLWPEPPPSRFEVRLQLDQLGELGTGTNFQRRKLVPVPNSPDREWVLREAAEAIGPIPTLAEQGGADIQYCPDYRPQLYPERSLGEMCADSLLSSPLLEQGRAAKNPFGVAFGEVDRMHRHGRKLLTKTLIAGAIYWQHRDSPAALDDTARAVIAKDGTGLANLGLNAIVPRVVRLLPREISGLPPYEELGAAYDIRVATPATYNSVVDTERMLRTAARRGLDGLAITDLDHLDGVRVVQRTADRLKARGELPEDFLVIPGEEVYTLSGPVVALFVTDRVQRGMTIKATIDDIHRQGGVAILADPGSESGPKLVRTLDVDGYLLRSYPASVLRTLGLLGDESLAAKKPLLSASGSRVEGSIGVPYTVAETPNRSPEGIRRAFREHTTFGATSVQMPLMAAMLFRPLVAYETTMASWFRLRDRTEERVARLIGSDNVEIRTSYDEELTNLLGLVRAPAAIKRLVDDTSPLTRTPRPIRVSADYGPVRIEYTWEDHTVWVGGAARW